MYSQASPSPWPQRALWPDVALTFGLYAVLAWLAIVVARLPGTAAVVWLANGMAIAMMLSAPPARAPALLAAAAAGNLAGNLAYGDPLRLSLAFLPPNLFEMALGVWLVRRSGLVTRYAEDQRTFLRVMAAGALLPPLLGATIGAATLHLLGFAEFSLVWFDWYIGAALGAVAMLPLGLALRAGAGFTSLQRLLEPASVTTLALLTLGTVAVMKWLPYPFVATCVMMLVVAFTRPRAETFAGVALAVVALALALAMGLMSAGTTPLDHVLLFFGALLALLPAQVVAVAVARQRALSQTLAAVGSRVDDIVTFADLNGVLRWVNRAREAYWGVPNSEILGRTAQEILPPAMWQSTVQPMYQAAGRGEVVRQLAEIDYPLRGRRTMDITMQPAHDEEGHLVGALYCAADVTELEASRRELERTAEALRASHHSLEQFVRIASHDLREPLNTITQFCGLIEQHHAAELSAQAAAYFTQVRSGTTRMRQTMDDVLQFARLGQDAPQPREPVDLDALLEEVRDNLRSLIAAQGARVELQAPLGVAHGHRSLLVIVVQNLLANALKFVPPGRAPEVRFSVERGLEEGANLLRLVVADNGIGIAAAHVAELGTPFRRLHARRKYEGTGLGLAICKRIAEQHGGRLEIASVPGEGSRFTLVLPGE